MTSSTCSIAHQDDAVQLATAEELGVVIKVKTWAGQVEASRRGQVATMLDLLKR